MEFDGVDFSSLAQCMDLRDRHIRAAVTSSDAMRALLAHFEKIAAPGKGAPILLAALARLGTTECDWIDGELWIEVFGDSKKSIVNISTDLGGGFREKLFPTVTLRSPFEEFARGVKRAPKLIQPLVVKETPNKIILTASREARKTSIPPAMVAIDPSCFLPDVPKLTAPRAVSEPESDPRRVVVRKRLDAPLPSGSPAIAPPRPKKA